MNTEDLVTAMILQMTDVTAIAGIMQEYIQQYGFFSNENGDKIKAHLKEIQE